MGKKLLQSAKQMPREGMKAKEGFQNRGTSVLVLGCVVTNNPALLHNQWWEPKVVSSNYYARVHSNRPPLVQEFTGKVLPGLKASPSKVTGERVWG